MLLHNHCRAIVWHSWNYDNSLKETIEHKQIQLTYSGGTCTHTLVIIDTEESHRSVHHSPSFVILRWINSLFDSWFCQIFGENLQNRQLENTEKSGYASPVKTNLPIEARKSKWLQYPATAFDSVGQGWNRKTQMGPWSPQLSPCITSREYACEYWAEGAAVAALILYQFDIQ